MLLLVSAFACGNATENTGEALVYQCPMDCEEGVTYSEEGICPVCEMDLEQIN